MKQIYKNIMLLIVSMIIVFLILEISFRVFAPQATYSAARKSSPKIFQKSDYLPEALKPNAKDNHIGLYGDFNVSIEVNSYGLRDYERHVASNMTRVLAMGDSMTFGFGVEIKDSYPKVLERMLNKNGEKYQVFNVGAADGDSPGTYYLYLKNYALQKFKPSTIIIGFTYTDITDPRRYKVSEDENGLPVKIESPYFYIDQDGRERIAKSALPILKYDAVDTVYRYLLSRSHFLVFAQKVVTNTFLVPFRDRVFDTNLSPEVGGYWDFNKKVIIAINDIAIKNKINLIIVIIPDRRQVSDDEWAQYSTLIGKEKLNRTKPNEIMKEFGLQNNIKVIDLYDIFHEKNKEMSIYLKIDGHPNPEGHKIIAEEIYKHVK